MFDHLSREQRLRLMQFVCSFAWADFEVRDEERAFIARTVRKLQLDDAERARVEEWLEFPPSPDDLDPQTIPAEHRELFLRVIRDLITADGEVAEEERESLDILSQLLD